MGAIVAAVEAGRSWQSDAHLEVFEMKKRKDVILVPHGVVFWSLACCSQGLRTL